MCIICVKVSISRCVYLILHITFSIFFSVVATWLFPLKIPVFSFRPSFLSCFHIQTGFNGFTILVIECPQGSSRSEKSKRTFITNYASNDWFTVKRCAINGVNSWPLAAWQDLIVNLLNNVSPFLIIWLMAVSNPKFGLVRRVLEDSTLILVSDRSFCSECICLVGRFQDLKIFKESRNCIVSLIMRWKMSIGKWIDSYFKIYCYDIIRKIKENGRDRKGKRKWGYVDDGIQLLILILIIDW